MLATHKLDTVSHLFLKGADYIEKNGHCKGVLRDAIGRVCALGAIFEVSGKSIDYGFDFIEMRKRLKDNIPEEYETVPDWNNAEERTAEEVIRTFREVAYNPIYAKVD